MFDDSILEPRCFCDILSKKDRERLVPLCVCEGLRPLHADDSPACLCFPLPDANGQPGPDLWIGAEDAVRLGLAHEIADSPSADGVKR